MAAARVPSPPQPETKRYFCTTQNSYGLVISALAIAGFFEALEEKVIS
jgi:hypothetical protein